ncbi:MAG TPA: histidine kinase, partial [Rugosimonospora sp.]|nr:histidine kinase [Rugosimonospora sp.]
APVEEQPALPSRQRPSTDGTIYTPAGLPWRVRQASLAPPLRSAGHRSDAPAEPDETPARGPEEIRRMMAAYQSGTMRGRSDAYQISAGPQPDTPADAAGPPAAPPDASAAPPSDPPVERG